MYTKEKIYYENIQNVNSKYIFKNFNNPNKISNYILGENVNKFENEFETIIAKANDMVWWEMV